MYYTYESRIPSNATVLDHGVYAIEEALYMVLALSGGLMILMLFFGGVYLAKQAFQI